MRQSERTYNPRHEKLVVDLCDEVDYWKEQAIYYKKQYEDELAATSFRLHADLENAKKGVANALMFALSVRDNEDGSLSISKEDRINLSESLILIEP